MSEFKEIKTQEEFDAAIKDRLARENKKYEGFVSPDKLVELKADYEKEISKKYENYTSPDELANMKKDYEGKIAKYESDSVKTRIANEMGLPSSIASRLKGANEEEIRKDAESFASLFQKEPPLATGEQTVATKEQEKKLALKKLLKGTKEGE